MGLIGIIKKVRLNLRKPDIREKEISELIEKSEKEESISNVVYFLNDAVDLYQKLTIDRGKGYRKDLLYKIKEIRENKLPNYGV